MQLKVKKFHKKAIVPVQATSGAGCFDLFATEDIYLYPGDTPVLIGTGIGMEIPKGYVGKIWARSGHFVYGDIVSHAGVIDSDYRGEIKVGLQMAAPRGHSRDGLIVDPYEIEYGTAIAQIAIIRLADIEGVKVVRELSSTERGEKGFGSTNDKKK